METFTNNPLAVESLPRVEELSLQPVEPQFRKILLWRWFIGWGIVFVAAVIVTAMANELHNFFTIIIIGLALTLLSSLNLWLMLKSFKRKAFAVREFDIIYRSGWLVQRLAICPFNRIQHCSVASGPLERKLGLASLSVHTAGTRDADIRIPGLKDATASSLCDFILKKTGADEQEGN